MASVEPAIGAPLETVHDIVSHLAGMPTVEQDFGFGIRFVVPVLVGNKDKFGSAGGPHATKTESDAGEALQPVVEHLAFVELAVPVDVTDLDIPEPVELPSPLLCPEQVGDPFAIGEAPVLD